MSVNLVVDSNLSATEQYVKDASGNTSNLAIGTDSKVGIGTTDPSTKLHLKASTDPEIVLRLDGNTGSKVGEISLYAGYGYMRLYDSGGANTVHLAGGSGGGATGESFFMGHLAVGLNNPAVNDKLTVKSAGTTSSYYGLKIQDSSGNNQLAVRSDGNVGIGTTSPAQKLDVNGNIKVNNKVFFIDNYTYIKYEADTFHFYNGGICVAKLTTGGNLQIKGTLTENASL